MKNLLLLVTLTFLSNSIYAQNIWKEYVMGRPMIAYFDAKKIVAEEWGIQYQPVFGGCVISDETSAQSKSYQETNEAYFKKLATKHGSNWMENFELAVKKEMYRSFSSEEKGIWYEIATEDQTKTFYEAKKIVAKEWGIDYQAKFIAEDMNAEDKAALLELFTSNQVYVNQLKNTFGQNWQEKLNQEVEVYLVQQKESNDKGIWIDYVVGKPYMAYFEAKKALAKEWGIQYETQFKGCDLSDEMEREAAIVEESNASYFKTLEKIHGKNWMDRFNKAVKERLAQQ